jgi:hypothetical protein
MAKKRARNDKGQLIGDDPSTPDVNEAWVDDEPKASPKAKAKQKKAPKPEAQSAFSVFISSDEEASVYDLRIGDSRVRGSWDGSRTHVWWKVPNDLVENMMKHHHVWSGRIIKAEDD